MKHFKLEGKRVFIAGHRGMVGSAILRRLDSERCEIFTVERGEVDLRIQAQVDGWMEANRPQVLLLAAAKVGGIQANRAFPADFLYDNLMVEANLIHSAYKNGVEKLVFLGSACIYPRLAPQPISERALLSGPLEISNEWYAIAKIAGIKLCQAYRRQHGCDFIAAQPTNLYGPGDNYDLDSSHVLPALLRKAYEAKCACAPSMTIWGSGTPKREFLHVDDLADALVFLAENYSGEDPVNVGSGAEITIRGLAELVCDIVGYEGRLEFDLSKPDGVLRRLVDSTKLNALGWSHSRELREGIAEVFRQEFATGGLMQAGR